MNPTQPSPPPSRRHSPHPRRRGTSLQQLTKEIRTKAARNHTPCFICGQPIDYTIPAVNPDGSRNPEAFSVDHTQPQSLHPELKTDPGNLKPSHLGCNWAKGNDPTRVPSLGLRSREW